MLSLGGLSRRAQLRQRRTGVAALSPVAVLVAEAAELLRRRELAQTAWERIVPPEWLRDSAVAGVSADHKDTATVAASNSALLYELRRRQSALERSLSRLAPGIRRLRFAVAAGPPDRV